jgi:hypothetical protein
LLENISKEDFKKYLKELHAYMKRDLKVDEDPRIVISSDKSNAGDIFGKTAHYQPDKKIITLYTFERHPKDVLRSFAHEYIHHWQHLNQKFDPQDMNATDEVGYAQKNTRLRELEREAFELGNMRFRDWCDNKKQEREGEEVGTMTPDNMDESKLPKKGKKHRKFKAAIRKFEKDVSKKDFTDRYGKEKGQQIYYATATKTAKKDAGVDEMFLQGDNLAAEAKEEVRKHYGSRKSNPSDGHMRYSKGINESMDNNDKKSEAEMIYTNVDPKLGQLFQEDPIVRRDMKDAHDQARYEELMKKFGITTPSKK